MRLKHQALKDRQRKERENHPPNLAVRVHRALSWLDRAEECQDNDGKFVFLWIAFNAAYAQEAGERERTAEYDAFSRFLEKIITLDKEKHLYDMVWTEFSGAFRTLLNNPFTYQPFWDAQVGKIGSERWRRMFEKDKKAVLAAIGKQDTLSVLSVVLSRLYTLRNQLVHGGATWNGQVNREQVIDGVTILSEIVPLVIQFMLDNPDILWGPPCYPVVKD